MKTLRSIWLFTFCIASFSCEDKFDSLPTDYDEMVIQKAGVLEFRIRDHKSGKNDLLIIENIGVDTIEKMELMLFSFLDTLITRSNIQLISRHGVTKLEKGKRLALGLFKNIKKPPNKGNTKLHLLFIDNTKNPLSGYYKGELIFKNEDENLNTIANVEGTIDFEGNIFLLSDNIEKARLIHGKVAQNLLVSGELLGESQKWHFNSSLEADSLGHIQQSIQLVSAESPSDSSCSLELFLQKNK